MINTILWEQVKKCSDNVATRTKISKSSVYMILRQELNMRKVCSKIVLKVLIPEQKQARMFMAETLLYDLDSNDSLLSQIITHNESSVFEYDPSTKCQTMQWKNLEEPWHKKAKSLARSERQ